MGGSQSTWAVRLATRACRPQRLPSADVGIREYPFGKLSKRRISAATSTGVGDQTAAGGETGAGDGESGAGAGGQVATTMQDLAESGLDGAGATVTGVWGSWLGFLVVLAQGVLGVTGGRGSAAGTHRPRVRLVGRIS